MEEIIGLLDSIVNTLRGVLVFSVFSFLCLAFILLIMVFDAYDKSKKDEKNV